MNSCFILHIIIELWSMEKIPEIIKSGCQPSLFVIRLLFSSKQSSFHVCWYFMTGIYHVIPFNIRKYSYITRCGNFLQHFQEVAISSQIDLIPCADVNHFLRFFFWGIYSAHLLSEYGTSHAHLSNWTKFLSKQAFNAGSFCVLHIQWLKYED